MIIVREVSLRDAEDVVALINPIIEAGRYTTFVSPFTVSDERAFIQQLPARGSFLGAFHVQSGQLRGFQVVTPTASYTSALDHVGEIGTYVGLGHQRQGVAGHLFAETVVRADNDGGLRSYRKCGFSEVGVAKQHARVGERYIDAVLLEYPLQSEPLRVGLV